MIFIYSYSYIILIFHTDKCHSFYPGDSSNDKTGEENKEGQNTDWKAESWSQGLRCHSSFAWNHVAVWALKFQFRYNRFQVHIHHF